MSLFRLVAKIGVDATEFNAGLKKAESGIEAVGKRVAAAFSVAAIAAFSKKILDSITDIADLADQLDLTTKQVQQLQFAASAAGVPFEALASAINKVRAAQASALSGDDNSLKLFKRLGVDPNQPAFDILQQAGFTEDKAALFDLLGTKAAKVFNALRDIQDLGPLEMISESDIKRTDDALDKLSANARKTTNIILNLLGLNAAIQQAPADLPRFLLNVARKKLTGKDQSIGSSNSRLGPPEYSSIFNTNSAGLFDPSFRKGRDSGEMFGPPEIFGPTNDEAKMQLYLRQARRSNATFSPVPTGDRANIGGFFGPNADVNNRMASELTKISRGIEAIDAKLFQALTTP